MSLDHVETTFANGNKEIHFKALINDMKNFSPIAIGMSKETRIPSAVFTFIPDLEQLTEDGVSEPSTYNDKSEFYFGLLNSIILRNDAKLSDGMKRRISKYSSRPEPSSPPPLDAVDP